MIDAEIIGKRVLMLRIQKGWSGEELANLLGVSRGTVSNWERGVYLPRKSNLRRLMDVGWTNTGELETTNPSLERLFDQVEEAKRYVSSGRWSPDLALSYIFTGFEEADHYRQQKESEKL